MAARGGFPAVGVLGIGVDNTNTFTVRSCQLATPFLGFRGGDVTEASPSSGGVGAPAVGCACAQRAW